jgi:proline iminopeptidase
MSEWQDDIFNVAREGADLYVERAGPKGAPVVYYLHGGPGYNSHSFRDLAGDDLEAYQVIYADQRGGGRSYGSGAADLTVLASDVAAVLNSLEVPRAVLLAHGFGALVAVEVARAYPHLVTGLVLMNPWLSMPLLARDLNRAAVRLAGGAADAATEPEEQGDEGYVGEPGQLVDEAFSLVNPKVLFDHLQFPFPSTRLRLEHSDADTLLGPAEEDEPVGVWALDQLPHLHELAGPTVLLIGRQDGTVYPTQAEAALSRMPGALVSIVEAGHYPWIDEPEAFTPLLHQALDHVTGAEPVPEES